MDQTQTPKMFPRSIKIDSKQGKTIVADAVSGYPVPGIVSVTVNIDRDTLEAHLLLRPIELAVDELPARFYIPDPATGKPREVRHIQFLDGGRWDPNTQDSLIIKPNGAH